MSLDNKILLEIKNISKRFFGVNALDSVSFKLNYGERLGIIGANGSGKTTLLNILSRLIDPDHGDLIYKGSSYLRIKPQSLLNIGFARSFQYTRNWKNMSIRDNLLNIPESWDNCNYLECFLNRKKQKNIEDKILLKASLFVKDFNLMMSDNGDDNIVGDLSIGQQRLIELIRIFLMNPEVLLLDEPSVGLSEDACTKVSEYFKYIVNKGNGVLFVSHDLQFLKRNTDRIIFLNQGQIIADGNYEYVMNNKVVQEAYLGGQC